MGDGGGKGKRGEFKMVETRRNRGNYTTMLKEGRKQEEKGRSRKVCTPVPAPLPLHHNLERVGEVFITYHTYHTVSS